MKVFEVITEHSSDNDPTIHRETQYVTSVDNTLKSVVDHFTTYCKHYAMDLIGVREVLTVVKRIGEA